MKPFLRTLLLTLLCVPLFAFARPIKIEFWHSMAGSNVRTLTRLVAQFNKSQSHYRVVLSYKGDYNTALTSLIAAFRAGQQPVIAQVFEVGTATMMASGGAIVPVYQLMAQYHYPLSKKAFLAPIAAYYSTDKGQLISLPFNASSPVFYYNRAAFKKAGLDPNRPPKTWPEVEVMGKKLLKAGYQCAYTTTWPDWIQLETFSAWHNLPFASAANGFAGYQVKVLYDNPLVKLQLATLARWQKEGLFEFGGAGDNAQSLFTSGHCAMLTQSSGTLRTLSKDVSFALGVAPLPYWPQVKDAPQNTIIGGASLWVMRGFSPAVYRGVAEFFHFLLTVKSQQEWQRGTGYLPLTHAAYQASEKDGYYRNNPGSDVAIRELLNKPPTKNSRGIRLGYFPQIRQLNITAMEAIFSGSMTVSEALNYATTRADRLLKKFNITTMGK